MLKKDITFIYMDGAEKSMYHPIAKEAVKRGYKVKLTDNKFETCEIGFYCQHVNFPQFSKFSVIMLHDIIQQYSNWPDLWYREPWNKYDIGILPSEQWEHNWNQCSQWFYANPRIGTYKIGWPKADIINEIKDCASKKSFCSKYCLDFNKPTILYAPAWENDGKQNDFVQSMLELDVNILIKQWDADPDKFPSQVENVHRMKELHKNIKNVTILPPSLNIFEAIAVSDILVSEESSTMCEAAMMRIPAVSVSNWLIPDVSPSRFPQCDYDFVVKTTKENLTDCIREMIDNYPIYKKKVEIFADQNFDNIGRSSIMIMDIIDDVVAGRDIRYAALSAQKKERVELKKFFMQKKYTLLREIYGNYSKRYRLVSYIWKLGKRIKNII